MSLILSIIAIIISIITIIIVLKNKKKYIQVVGEFIVYNPKGVEAGKISIGDTILGKKEDKFIIADKDHENYLGVYFSNSKTDNK